MSKAKSPHGTARRYWSGCRCADCLTAHNNYCRSKHRERQDKRENPIVSAEAARLHLVKLKRDFRITADAVALATGIRRAPLMQIRNGRQKRIRRQREREILAIGAEAAKHLGMVASDDTRLLLQKISEAGLSQLEIGIRLGLSSKPRIARKPFVQVGKALAVEALYVAVFQPKVAPKKWVVTASHVLGHTSLGDLMEQVREAVRNGKDTEKDIALHAQLSEARVESILGYMILADEICSQGAGSECRYFFRRAA